MRDDEAQKWTYRSKNCNETVRFQFEKRDEWIQKVRAERPQATDAGGLYGRVITSKKLDTGDPL